MSDQQIQTTEQALEQKRAAWGKMGVGVYTGELQLQLRGQQIETTLVVPTDIKDLTTAEQTLKIAKQNRDILIEDRKKITGKLNDVIDRLMKPEKAIDQKISEFTAGLLKIKKQAEEEEKKQQQKRQELKQVAEKVRIYIADMNAAFLTGFAKLLSDSYEHALANIKPEDIDAYIAKLKAQRITEAKYTMVKPSINAVFATQQEVNAEIEKSFTPKTAKLYIEGFELDIKAKYSDYKLAWDNKEQALELNKQEAKENTAAIQQQQQQDVVAANIQAMAATPIIGAPGKSIKQVYKLAMDETFEDANIVCMAYLANSDKCRAKMQITKWLTGLGTKQMINALEKIKNEDDKFDFNGLKWLIEDKL